MKFKPQAYYRPSTTLDPEERCEDAALFKALFDAFEGKLAALDEDAPTLQGLTYGRVRKSDPSGDFPYWNDPAFLAHSARAFGVFRFAQLGGAVAALHEQGKGAFVKSCRAKFLIARVPVGTDWRAVVGDMAYAFDDDSLLMVQELVTIRYEWRYFAIGREIVACSPNAAHLTPLDYPTNGRCYATPQSRHPARFRDSDALVRSLAKVAYTIAREMITEDAVIDVAEIGGKAGCVELNPMLPGCVGLFACNVRGLAKAVVAAHPRLTLPVSPYADPVATATKWIDG